MAVFVAYRAAQGHVAATIPGIGPTAGDGRSKTRDRLFDLHDEVSDFITHGGCNFGCSKKLRIQVVQGNCAQMLPDKNAGLLAACPKTVSLPAGRIYARKLAILIEKCKLSCESAIEAGKCTSCLYLRKSQRVLQV